VQTRFLFLSNGQCVAAGAGLGKVDYLTVIVKMEERDVIGSQLLFTDSLPRVVLKGRVSAVSDGGTRCT
jgi:hypothetical protein